MSRRTTVRERPPKTGQHFWYGSHTVYRYLHKFTCIHIDINYIIICIHVYIYIYAIMYIHMYNSRNTTSEVIFSWYFWIPNATFQSHDMAQGNLDWDPHGVFEVHSLGPCGRPAGPAGPVGLVIRTPKSGSWWIHFWDCCTLEPEIQPDI